MGRTWPCDAKELDLPAADPLLAVSHQPRLRGHGGRRAGPGQPLPRQRVAVGGGQHVADVAQPLRPRRVSRAQQQQQGVQQRPDGQFSPPTTPMPPASALICVMFEAPSHARLRLSLRTLRRTSRRRSGQRQLDCRSAKHVLRIDLNRIDRRPPSIDRPLSVVCHWVWCGVRRYDVMDAVGVLCWDENREFTTRNTGDMQASQQSTKRAPKQLVCKRVVCLIGVVCCLCSASPTTRNTGGTQASQKTGQMSSKEAQQNTPRCVPAVWLAVGLVPLASFTARTHVFESGLSVHAAEQPKALCHHSHGIKCRRFVLCVCI